MTESNSPKSVSAADYDALRTYFESENRRVSLAERAPRPSGKPNALLTIIMLVASFFIIPLEAWAMVTCWAWFCPTLPVLTFPTAMGINFVLSVVQNPTMPQDTDEKRLMLLIYTLLRAPAAVALAWVTLHLFL